MLICFLFFLFFIDLNSSGPLKNGWKLLNSDESLHKYSLSLTRFLLSILRSLTSNPSDFIYPLEEDQKVVAIELHAKASLPGSIVKLVHAFCLLLFRQPSIVKSLEKWSCPLLCYFAAQNMREDGSFSDAHHITSELAHWEYLMRATTLYEIYHTANKYPNGILGCVMSVLFNVLNYSYLSDLWIIVTSHI